MRPLPPSSTGGTDWSGSHTVTIAFVSNGAMHCRNASALGRRRAASRTASLGTASPDRSPGGGRRFLPLPLGVLVVRLPPRALCVADARGLRRAWVGRGSPSISTGTLRQQAPSAKKDAARARRGSPRTLVSKASEGSQSASERRSTCMHTRRSNEFTRSNGDLTPNSSAFDALHPPSFHRFTRRGLSVLPFASLFFEPRLPLFLPPSQDPSCCSFAFPPRNNNESLRASTLAWRRLWVGHG